MNRDEIPDLLNRLLLADDSGVHALRQKRAKVVSATEGSYQALFDPALPGSLSLEERLHVAWHAARLTPQVQLAAHYRERLQALSVDPEPLAVSARLQAVLDFTRTLALKPVDGDRQALNHLLDAGLSTTDVVTLGQLIAFISYQVRLAAGLNALQALEQTP